ncbi:MAG: DUF1553 domain-containing protein [Reichenbachiella sp.]
MNQINLFHTVLFTSILIFFSQCSYELPEEVSQASKSLPAVIDYSLHVKPILSDKCFACHGPDKANRKAELRLDTKEGIYAALNQSNGKAFIPGNVSKSVAFQRIMSDDEQFMMPPPESHLTITPKEKAILAKWIDQGAEWKQHWAFIKPIKNNVPNVDHSEKLNNEIDNFIAERLQREALEFSEKADKITLIRRASFDIRGIPPSIQEIDDFLNDIDKDAFENLVDEFLTSIDAAERLTLEWLDVARYADSHGLHSDGPREMWPWRDWVIKAFDNNMPYDEFIKWQLAGDLLPESSKEQKLATAFNRNHPMSAEGGIIDEEFRVSYVLDRTNTTSRAFLGLTFECSQCHDHKYDPLSQKEYYEFSAFYNNVNELGLIGDNGNFGPTLALTSEKTDSIIAYIEQEIENDEKKIAIEKGRLFELDKTDLNLSEVKVRAPLAEFHFDTTYLIKDKKKEIFKSPNAVKSKFFGKASKILTTVPGVKGNAHQFGEDTEFINLFDDVTFEKNEHFSFSIWVNIHEERPLQGIYCNTGHKTERWRGHEMLLDKENKVSIALMNCRPTDGILVTSRDPIPLNTWTNLTVTYDGSSKAKGLKLYVNGELVSVEEKIDNLYRTIVRPPWKNWKGELQRIPMSIGKTQRTFGGDNGYFQGDIDELSVFDVTLSSLEVARIYQKIRPEFEMNISDEMIAEHDLLVSKWYQTNSEKLAIIHGEHQSVYDTIIDIMVMQEQETPRQTYLLGRGAYDARKDEVFPNTPSILGSLSDSMPRNRIGLADWLTSRENPVVSRVIVNRYWQMIFGRGIVSTPQDFGSQGALPTHPELLDWLAVDFMESGWDLKGLLKKMVLSSTYQQTSRTTPELYERDPENILLSRGPKNRMQAEMIRDNSLMASGLLVKKIGGKSVKPYQPDGLWDVSSFSDLNNYHMDKGDDLYRKSMYTFVRRTLPPPNMQTFDAPNRSYCVVKRQRTSTPLQALVLLNDPQFVEMCRAMADRIQNEGGTKVEDQISYGFNLLTGRKATKEELNVLIELYKKEFQKYLTNPKAITALNEVGSYKSNESLDAVASASLTMICNVMMSHEEAFYKL